MPVNLLSTVIHGNALTVLGAMKPASIQTCITSPPYWGLRDYGTGMWTGGDRKCKHSQPRSVGKSTLGIAKGHGSHESAMRYAGECVVPYRDLCRKCGAQRVDDQIGLEKTPEEYVAKLVAVFAAVRRVLRDDGTLWLNLGDSYAASTKGSSGTWRGPKQKPYEGALHTDRRWQVPAGLKGKDLVGIPWMVAFALRADGWYLRSDIIWHKCVFDSRLRTYVVAKTKHWEAMKQMTKWVVEWRAFVKELNADAEKFRAPEDRKVWLAAVKNCADLDDDFRDFFDAVTKGAKSDKPNEDAIEAKYLNQKFGRMDIVVIDEDEV
jgi:DNA modification methylase